MTPTVEVTTPVTIDPYVYLYQRQIRFFPPLPKELDSERGCGRPDGPYARCAGRNCV